MMARLAVVAMLMAGPVQAAPMALSAVLAGVEGKAGRTVFSAENKRGQWEIVSCEGRRDLVCREDVIDANTGATLRSERELVVDRRPPAGAKSASAIARGIESAGLGDIRELEWDSRLWEARLRGPRGRAEIDIDPMTGAVRRCEGPGCRR